jgi:conjugal transfer pilin signal peptidase TrbI
MLRVRGAIILGLVMLALGAGVKQFTGRYGFAINMTQSLPNWAFITDRQDKVLQRGDLVEFSPPPTPYYPAKTHFVKRVAGIAGDKVETRGRRFYVAGQFVGLAKTRSKTGQVAALGPVGTIPPGHYFVVGEHVDSLDSRYGLIGWIGADHVIGKAVPVL